MYLAEFVCFGCMNYRCRYRSRPYSRACASTRFKMADSQEEEKTPKSEEDFMDPLGANDPLTCGLEDGFDDLDFDVSKRQAV